ncbi:hypothetical protein HKBW3S43_01371 [Candidatus Hakubella thermalkaliphila]|uniref:Stage II sporulation protein M n=1 Tax=Candidatus Hakubella thermalkaliphila TaxID=2754717 RepID=A0A6V8PXW0_9ACTN|nr:hypothetical protein [Candidatus Hakubella thermalkaliphila]GFP35581.1 hypothetical protein HKBW3S43_01371 [Candidatus Hakubella thermalkaliphila]
MKNLFKWIFICALWYIVGFLVGWIMVFLFPFTTSSLIIRYKWIQSLVGIREAARLGGEANIFLTILVGNTLSTASFLVLGALLLGSLISFLLGILISLLLFTGPYRHGMSINASIVQLVAIESLYRILATSLGMFVGAKLSGASISFKPVLVGSSQSWPAKGISGLGQVCREHKGGIIVALLTITLLILYGAVFETFFF